MQVTCQCGVPLQSLDDMLRERGLTTGHSRSLNHWHSWEAWWQLEVSDSSPHSMAGLKT